MIKKRMSDSEYECNVKIHFFYIDDDTYKFLDRLRMCFTTSEVKCGFFFFF